MATVPKAVTIEAELILRYKSGKETALGAIAIEQGVHYQFAFEKTDTPLPETAITESLARIQGAAE